MLLEPKDSTVITYGVADNTGRFTIPCDSRNVIAKLSCVGYKTTYRRLTDFNVGDIMLINAVALLDEVTVTANSTVLYKNKVSFFPSKKEKKNI